MSIFHRHAPFLTARWQYLAMLNFEVDPKTLMSYVPRGTELDHWNGRTYLSLIGFLFLDTRIKGISIPFHRHFEEINLRFYVKRKDGEVWKRGVVFIKEIVPRRAIAWTARVLYQENYVALPTRHVIHLDGSSTEQHVTYAWCFQDRWNSLTVVPEGKPRPLQEGSEEAFIAEHYWGYSAQTNGVTLEYEVRHPPWNLWQVSKASVDIDIASLYGEVWVKALSGEPSLAFLADGSEIAVLPGHRIPAY